MNEQFSHIVAAYDDFKHFGIISPDEAVDDPETMKKQLDALVDGFEQDIEAAYKDKKSIRSVRLSNAMFLRIILDNGSEEELHEFITKNGPSQRFTIDERREDAIKALKSTHKKAEAELAAVGQRATLELTEEDFRTLDDSLYAYMERGQMTKSELGSLRLLFGLVNVPGDASPVAVAHLKGSAVNLLRVKLATVDCSGSTLAQHGEMLLHRITTTTRTGYPTVESIALQFAYNEEEHLKAPYGKDPMLNARMIETYMSEALDVIYTPPPIE